jgi:hypothetical protein
MQHSAEQRKSLSCLAEKDWKKEVTLVHLTLCTFFYERQLFVNRVIKVWQCFEVINYHIVNRYISKGRLCYMFIVGFNVIRLTTPR